MSKAKRPRLPKPGQVVEIHWLDSGLNTSGRAKGKPDSLHVARCWGEVFWVGEDTDLDVPKWIDRTTVWVVHDGAKGDSGANLGAVWWPCVVACKVLGE